MEKTKIQAGLLSRSNRGTAKTSLELSFGGLRRLWRCGKKRKKGLKKAARFMKRSGSDAAKERILGLRRHLAITFARRSFSAKTLETGGQEGDLKGKRRGRLKKGRGRGTVGTLGGNQSRVH